MLANIVWGVSLMDVFAELSLENLFWFDDNPETIENQEIVENNQTTEPVQNEDFMDGQTELIIQEPDETVPIEEVEIDNYDIMPGDMTQESTQQNVEQTNDTPKTTLTYNDLYAPYFGDCYVDSCVHTIELATTNENGEPTYYLRVTFEPESYDFKHINNGILGKINMVEVKYRTIEEAKTMYDMLSESKANIWWNSEECYYDYYQRKDPKGSKYVYCIIDPLRGKDEFMTFVYR
jgi:hypothetical protein